MLGVRGNYRGANQLSATESLDRESETSKWQGRAAHCFRDLKLSQRNQQDLGRAPRLPCTVQVLDKK